MFKQKVIDLLKKEIKDIDIENYLEVPPKEEMGDFAFPCFILSKKFKKSPLKIAEELANKLKENKYIIKIQNIGPYINFFVNRTIFNERILKEVIKKKDKFGSNLQGKNKKALIEHTSTNPNASPHIGRGRNAIIGDSVSRLLIFLGYKVERHYFVNDIGKQVAMLVYGSKGKKPSFKDLLDIYININKKLNKNPKLEKEIFTLLKKLELNDIKVKRDFKKIVDICLKGQMKILKELDINFDSFDYESKYLFNNQTNKIIKELEKKGKVFLDEYNRKILNLEDYNLPLKSPVLVLTRKDQTSLYVVRDIAYTLDKIKKIKSPNLIILGEDHKTYFKQLKIALEILGKKAPEPIFYSYILLNKGKMSTRQGKVVLLEDLMNEAKIKAEKEIKKRHGNTKDIKKRAKNIAFGAIKYSILKVSADKNVNFDINTALSFEGDSAPYIQYSYARSFAILNKVNHTHQKIDFSLITTIEENKLIKHIWNFSNIIDRVFENYQIHLIANYTKDLAQYFNEFYHTCPILSEEENLKNARIYLVKAFKQVLENCLFILGIKPLKKM